MSSDFTDFVRNLVGTERNAAVELDALSVKDHLKNFGAGVAEAQSELDEMSIKAAIELAKPEKGVTIDGQKVSLLELGFYPSFYHFTEASIELKLSITTEFGIDLRGGVGFGAGVGSGGAKPESLVEADKVAAAGASEKAGGR